MRILRPLSRRPAFALALVAAAACGDAVTESPVGRRFDRPVDVAFGCWGKMKLTSAPTAEATSHAQPLASCRIRAVGDGNPANTDPVPPGQEGVANSGLFWYTVAVQPTSGTITAVNYQVKGPADHTGAEDYVAAAYNLGEFSVEDSDPFTPGHNSLAVGSSPIAIDTDTAGCHLLTANAGSCDLSVIDLQRLVIDDGGGVVASLPITAGGQPLLARPAAMVAADLASPIGVECPADPIGIHYIAYPDCHAVAAIDAATGEVVASIRFADDGTATLGDGALACPRQCGARDPIVDGARPVSLDVVRDDRAGTQKLAIALDNRPVATVVTLDVGGLPSSVQQIDLEGDIGLVDVALSKQITMGGTLGLDDGAGDGDEAQFVYAVATDGSVRVAELLGAGVECDTQVDTRYLTGERNGNRLICLGVGQVGTPPRRVGATGPGIRTPGAGRPVSVAIGPSNNKRATGAVRDPDQLAGHFAYIALSNGFTLIANIDDDNIFDTMVVSDMLASQVPLVLPHQLRDNVASREANAVGDLDNNSQTPATRNCGDTGPVNASGFAIGSPHADGLPLRVIPNGALSTVKAYSLPYFHQNRCVGGADGTTVTALPDTSFASLDEVRLKTFPDLSQVFDEDWSFTWEGSLSRDRTDGSQVIDGPVIRTGVLDIGGGGISITDGAMPYCAAGVEPRDLVTLRGCDPARGDAQCSVGETCYSHPDATIASGACLPIDRVDELAAVCRDYLISIRRYSVVDAFAGRLTLRERVRELRTTPVDGCTSTAQCQELARYDLSLLSDDHPSESTPVEPTFTYQCLPDPYRTTAANRCMMTCERDDQCADGTLCRAGRCVEGIVPAPECAAGLQRYDLRASEAFVAVGSVSGYRHPIVADASGRCIVNPAANLLERGRIPLSAPPCTGTGPDGPTPNPCSETVDQTEVVADYVAGTCEVASDAGKLITRSAQGIRFRNAVMDVTMVDPTYPGDAMCRGDRGGSFVGVRTVTPALELQFHIAAGFSAKLAGDAASQPVSVVRAPDDAIWVIDSGDIRNSSTDVRGQLLRVSPRSPRTALHIQ